MEWRGKEPSLHINFLLSQSRKTIFPELSNRLSLSVHRQSWVMYPYLRGFSGGSAGKESTCNERELSSIPGLERPPGEGTGYPLHYSGLENSMNCIDHGVTKSWTRLSNFYFIL